MNHTPGPWTTGGSLISNGKETIALILRRPAVYGGKRYETRDTDRDAPETRSTIDANSRLIASAPDLLAENERLRALLAHFTSDYRQIIRPVEGFPEYVSMQVSKSLLSEIRATLAPTGAQKG
jgi:hypothetical protein